MHRGKAVPSKDDICRSLDVGHGNSDMVNVDIVDIWSIGGS